MCPVTKVAKAFELVTSCQVQLTGVDKYITLNVALNSTNQSNFNFDEMVTVFFP